jgi:chloride channel protein, CIC family
MRSPFTAVVFAVEVTHDTNALLPLLIAATAAHVMSVLLLRRSILTEKVARRGVHVSREYASDPLEAMRVREVMRVDGALPALSANGSRPVAAHPHETLRRAADRMAEHGLEALPVVGDEPGRVVGVVTPLDLFRAHERARREEVLRERGLGPPV